MATEVLRPQNCLIGPQPGFPRRKSINGRVNRRSKAGQSDPPMRKSNPVTILNRGKLMDRRNLGDVYAGSGFLSTSPPPPSSLPLPSFSTRSFVDDSATRDLRRLLRLE